jgi:cobalt-precorrin-7 (C5)-methyltransferase
MEYKIIVVGIGPGSPDYLPPVAAKAIEEAKVLVGSQRALDTFAPGGAQTKVIDKDITGVLSFIRERLQHGDVAVMVSGDPGFYSMLSALRREFAPECITVIPGVSSVQLAFARIACPWQDALLVSLHGRDVTDGALAYAPNKKLGILTDSQHDPRYIACLLLEQGWPVESQTWLCADLSYPSEQVVAVSLSEAAQISAFGHSVMVVMS